MVAIVNLPELYIGASYDDVSLSWLEDDQVTPINMTGYEVELQVRKLLEDVSPLYTFSTLNGKMGLTPLEAKMTFQISDEDSATFETSGKTPYIYGLLAFSPTGQKIPICKGKWPFLTFPAR